MHTALYSASCNNIILIVNTQCTCDTKIHIKRTQEVPTLLRARTLLLASSTPIVVRGMHTMPKEGWFLEGGVPG